MTQVHLWWKDDWFNFMNHCHKKSKRIFIEAINKIVYIVANKGNGIANCDHGPSTYTEWLIIKHKIS